METCNQIKIGPNSLLGQVLNVPLTLRIITPGAPIKSAEVNKDDFSDIEEEPIFQTNDNKSIVIYPNPAKQNFKIKTIGQSIIYSYELINSMGISVKIGYCSNPETLIDISSISSGIYIVKIFTSDEVVNKKLIVE